jgi:hypothetical protein
MLNISENTSSQLFETTNINTTVSSAMRNSSSVSVKSNDNLLCVKSISERNASAFASEEGAPQPHPHAGARDSKGNQGYVANVIWDRTNQKEAVNLKRTTKWFLV